MKMSKKRQVIHGIISVLFGVGIFLLTEYGSGINNESGPITTLPILVGVVSSLMMLRGLDFAQRNKNKG